MAEEARLTTQAQHDAIEAVILQALQDRNSAIAKQVRIMIRDAGRLEGLDFLRD